MAKHYNPDVHHRRSIRLSQWNYRSRAAYFVTFCTHERTLLFDDPRYRAVAEAAWQAIPMHPSQRHVQLDDWVVMPNHVHGILVLAGFGSTKAEGGTTPIFNAGPRSDSPCRSDPPRSQLTRRCLRNTPSGTLGAVVGAYKSQVARHINHLRHMPAAPVWQRGYYEHIVRSDDDWDRIRAYIRDNPARWAEGRDELIPLLTRMTHHP